MRVRLVIGTGSWLAYYGVKTARKEPALQASWVGRTWTTLGMPGVGTSRAENILRRDVAQGHYK